MKPYSNNIKLKAIKLRKQNLSIPKISAKLNVSSTTIANWTKDIKTSNTHPLYKTAKIIHDYFSEENMKLYPERYVIVGFIAADGCIYNRKSKNKYYKQLCFNICNKDKIILDILNKELTESSRNISYIRKTNSIQMVIPSEQICKDLSLWGIIPKKTKNITLPKLSLTEMKYFLRGYFYGDGCYYVDNKGRELYHIIGNNYFTNDLKKYLESFNFVEYVGRYQIKHANNYYELRMPGKHAKSFANFIYNDNKMILLPRKHINI